MQEAIIRILDLKKTYETKLKHFGIFTKEVRQVEALKGINLEIFPGDIYGLLGPNGAGKTTLIKILTTLLLPTAGNFILNGYDGSLDSNERKIKASLGIMLMGERSLYWKLTPLENLEYFAALYHLSSQFTKQRIPYLMDLLEFEEYADRPVETLSSGQKMTIVFARALLNDAPILLLDEPTNTLDVNAARELRALVKKINREENKTILYCSHQMSEIEELCNRCCILDHGEVIAEGTPQELCDELDADDIIQIDGNFNDETITELKTFNQIKNISIHSIDASDNGSQTKDLQRIMFSTDDSRVILPSVLQILLENGSRVEHIYPKQPSLEDVFVSYTGRSLSEDTTKYAG